MRRIDEQSHGQTFDTHIGSEVEICLPENPTTGFRWKAMQTGEPVCTLLKDAFEPGRNAPGQPGTHTWVFKVVAEGSTTIELIYQRSWDAGSAVRAFTLYLNAKR
jgi:inhibitor of cysteine peptidase